MLYIHSFINHLFIRNSFDEPDDGLVLVQLERAVRKEAQRLEEMKVTYHFLSFFVCEIYRFMLPLIV